MTDYTPQQIAGFIEARRQDITEIERLFMQLCKLRGEKVDYRALDKKINDYFSVEDGRKALGFESIEQTKQLLKTAIFKEERREKK